MIRTAAVYLAVCAFIIVTGPVFLLLDYLFPIKDEDLE